MKMKVTHGNNNNNHGGSGKHQSRKIKELRKVYESPKFFLRENSFNIEIAVEEDLSLLFSEYNEWRMGKKKRPEYIFNMFLDIAFASVLPGIVKRNYDLILDNGEAFSEMLSNAINELQRRRQNRHKEMIQIYTDIYEDLNEDRIRKIFKQNFKGIEWQESLRLCIASHGSPRHTTNNLLRTIYQTVKFHDFRSLHKLLVKLYRKSDMSKIAIYILLEKRQDGKGGWIDRQLFNALTDLALTVINSCKKKEIRELLKLYCEERRKSEFDQSYRRRVQISEIPRFEYDRIAKIARKLAKKNEMYRIFLDFPGKK